MPLGLGDEAVVQSSSSSPSALVDVSGTGSASITVGAGLLRPAQRVEVGQRVEHRRLVDAEVDQAGDLVDAEPAQPLDGGQAALRRAEQPGRADVALEGVVHDHGHLVLGEVVEARLGPPSTVAPAVGLAKLVCSHCTLLMRSVDVRR